jgi:hypothetical protein
VRDLLAALTLLATPGIAAASAIAASSEAQEWTFRVLLDDREIGTHRYSVVEQDEELLVESRARFSVKLLFVEAYRYVHEARERWRGDCLESIEARTDDNGRELRLRGRRDGGGLVIATGDGGNSLRGCVMSFAYWNPAILQQSKLLNMQTGEHVDIRIEALGSELLPVRGGNLTARRYALHADDFRIDVWYTPDDRWVRLESRTASGQRLRYEIQ